MKHDLVEVVVAMAMVMAAFGGEETSKGRPRRVHLPAVTPRSCHDSTIF